MLSSELVSLCTVFTNHPILVLSTGNSKLTMCSCVFSLRQLTVNRMLFYLRLIKLTYFIGAPVPSAQ